MSVDHKAFVRLLNDLIEFKDSPERKKEFPKFKLALLIELGNTPILSVISPNTVGMTNIVQAAYCDSRGFDSAVFGTVLRSLERIIKQLNSRRAVYHPDTEIFHLYLCAGLHKGQTYLYSAKEIFEKMQEKG